jgi:hypothetical protein
VYLSWCTVLFGNNEIITDHKYLVRINNLILLHLCDPTYFFLVFHHLNVNSLRFFAFKLLSKLHLLFRGMFNIQFGSHVTKLAPSRNPFSIFLTEEWGILRNLIKHCLGCFPTDFLTFRLFEERFNVPLFS